MVTHTKDRGWIKSPMDEENFFILIPSSSTKEGSEMIACMVMAKYFGSRVENHTWVNFAGIYRTDRARPDGTVVHMENGVMESPSSSGNGRSCSSSGGLSPLSLAMVETNRKENARL